MIVTIFLSHRIVDWSIDRMSKYHGSSDGAEAASRGYSSPGIIRHSQAASEMSAAWSSGIGKDEVSSNQSKGASYVNSHGGRQDIEWMCLLNRKNIWFDYWSNYLHIGSLLWIPPHDERTVYLKQQDITVLFFIRNWKRYLSLLHSTNTVNWGKSRIITLSCLFRVISVWYYGSRYWLC